VVAVAAARAAVAAVREVVVAGVVVARVAAVAVAAAEVQVVPQSGISTPTLRPAARVASVAKRAGAMAAAEVGWVLG